MIILILLFCAVLSCISIALVIAHVPAAFRIVGDTVASNILSLSLSGKLLLVSSCWWCVKVANAQLNRYCNSVCHGAWKVLICPRYFILREHLDVHFPNVN